VWGRVCTFSFASVCKSTNKGFKGSKFTTASYFFKSSKAFPKSPVDTKSGAMRGYFFTATYRGSGP